VEPPGFEPAHGGFAVPFGARPDYPRGVATRLGSVLRVRTAGCKPYRFSYFTEIALIFSNALIARCASPPVRKPFSMS